MINWKSETERYLKPLEEAVALLDVAPSWPANIPHGPFEEALTPRQVVLYRATSFYEVGIWIRARETMVALLLLWREGYFSPAATLARLVLELWGACHYQTAAIKRFRDDMNLESLAKVVNRLFEGVRDDVSLPWGTLANEKPIHIMDLVRALKSVVPQAESMYSDLCESSHANQPRFFEWWLTGRLGDNWSNQSVQARGHDLLNRTVSTIQAATEGLVKDTRIGLQECGLLYDAA